MASSAKDIQFKEMFARLPVCRVEVDTPTEEQKRCPVCQSQMIPIAQEEFRTEIRYTRAKLERVVYIATTYGCPVCKETDDPQFIKDEGLPALIPGGYAFSCPVSHIMYEKYADALPLYRQERGFELLGVSISRTTMAEMAKAHGLHPYSYLKYLLDSRPSINTSDAKLAAFAPWSETARIACNRKSV